MDMDKQFQRIDAIVGDNAERDFTEAMSMFYAHLRQHLVLPCDVTGIYSLLLFVSLTGCSGAIEGVNYEQYVALKQDEGMFFDPVGAADIFHSSAWNRDGTEVWWRLSITADGFNTIVADVAKKDSGSANLIPDSEPGVPASWAPDSPTPGWWDHRPNESFSSYHWCYAAGDADRHHGTYLGYDQSKKLMYVWCWNHQWSGSECVIQSSR